MTPQELNDPQKHKSFEDWFSSDFLNLTVRYGLIMIGAIGTILGMAGDITEGNEFLREWVVDNATYVIVILHLLLIFLILGPARIRPLNTNIPNPVVRRSAQCLNHFFLKAWKLIWISFGFIYIIYAVQLSEATVHQSVFSGINTYYMNLAEAIFDAVGDVASTIAIILAAVFLSPEFLRDYNAAVKANEREGQSNRYGEEKLLHFAGYFSKDKFRIWWITLLTIGILFLKLVGIHCQFQMFSFSIDPKMVCFAIPILFSAGSIGFLAGRLDNPFISNWKWVVILLYVYGSIQIFGSISYGESPEQTPMFYYAAFTLKCVWFLFVSDLFADKRILYYAYEVIRKEEETIL
jgi:hypothetical protein